jgi:phage terminase large subunit
MMINDQNTYENPEEEFDEDFEDYEEDSPDSESQFILNYHVYFDPIYNPDNPNYKRRYMIWYGGRAGRKSWEIARGLLLRSASSKLRIVCAREFQNSIADSVLKLLEDQIGIMGMEKEFDVQRTTIYHKYTGSQFIFKGLAKANIQALKSLEGADLCWVEEAQVVSEDSWKILTPTIRKPGSQIIISLNPELAEDPTSVRYLINTPPNSYICKINYTDNIDCTPEIIEEAEWCKITDLDAYKHVWLGEFRKASDAQILKDKWIVDRFEPKATWDGPYYGMDFGFSTDPMACVEVWVDSIARKLYVRRESVRRGVEVEEMEEHITKMPGSKRFLHRADNARPELISYLNLQGFNVVAAQKWQGSIEDGITFLRSFIQIVIHPDCKNTEFECKYYSYKIDKLTGEVTTNIVDKHNHCIDAIRYAIEPIVTRKFINYKNWVK